MGESWGSCERMRERLFMMGCQNSKTGQNRLFWFSLSHWRASQPSAGTLRCQVDPGILLLWCEAQFTAPGTQAEQGGGWQGTCLLLFWCATYSILLEHRHYYSCESFPSMQNQHRISSNHFFCLSWKVSCQMMVKKLRKEGIKHPEESDEFVWLYYRVHKKKKSWYFSVLFMINLLSFCRLELVFFDNISTYLCIFIISTIQKTAFEWMFKCIFNRTTFNI